MKIRIGTINIATYTNKEDEILDMMENRNIDILGLAETRHRGEERGRELRQGYTLMYKGIHEGTRIHGVAVITGPRLSPHIQEVELISERLMKVSIKVKSKKYNFYQVYAPQQGRTIEEKTEFLNLLEENYNGNEEEVTVMMGDFNGRVGKERNGIEHIIGPFGEEVKNEEGEWLLDLCVRNNLKIMT